MKKNIEGKKSFLFYHDYRKHLAMLTDEERGRLLMGLLNYADGDEVPRLDGPAAMAFSFISAQMDRDAEKYAEVCQKRSKAGKKGAERRWGDGGADDAE